MRHKHLLGALAIVLCSAQAAAFETHTHAYITYNAFKSSKLADESPSRDRFFSALGLGRLSSRDPFSAYWLPDAESTAFYFDNLPDGSAQDQFPRRPGRHEWMQMDELRQRLLLGTLGEAVGVDETTDLTLINWLIRGVILEDQLIQSSYDGSLLLPPDPDPRSNYNRVYNHFYDPIHDTRLTPLELPCEDLPYSGDHCQKSVDWALGTVDAFTSPVPAIDRHNHFSWADARTNYFQALTLRRDLDLDGVRSAAERAANSRERLSRWATAFRSLGSTAHLLQDAAQPQHTRNDRHDPVTTLGERQAFEPFTNMRLLGIESRPASPTRGEKYVYSLTGSSAELLLSPLPGLDNYPIPQFASPLRFFTTRNAGEGPGVSPMGRHGLADYSNRGFFTAGTPPSSESFPFPPNELTPANGYSLVEKPCDQFPVLNKRATRCEIHRRAVTDTIAPGRPDATTPQPLFAVGMWNALFSFGQFSAGTLGPEIFHAQGNLAMPRAIAYSAGLINYFFRGELEVVAPADRVVGVLNHGATHTMNTPGYACEGTASNDGCALFGFERVRLRVRNTTATTTESGSGIVAPQSTGGAGAQLVAVARYHRNTCYKPDLSGERVQSYASPPAIAIAEPVCSGEQTVRSAYQEISVSEPLTVTAGELDNLAAGSGVEKVFDFSTDPIPVNATDLFLQVVYRGPLGAEPDGIAVGILDVRETTFASFWNNTDYYWNNSAWLSRTPTYPNQSVKDFWVCSGGTPVKLVFHYVGAAQAPAMIDPVIGAGTTGQVRLGFLFPPPDPGIPTQRKAIRGTSVNYSTPGYPPIPVRSAFSSGQFRQASGEKIAAATLAAPVATCSTQLPTTAEYWCFDPVQERRDQRFGSPAQPLYLEPTAGGVTPTDVDSVPLPAFASTTVLVSGDVRFNSDTTLQSCPPPPALDTTADIDRLLRIESAEEAANLGLLD